MKLPGFCTECHRPRQVRVSGAGMATLAAGGPPRGICDACADEQAPSYYVKRSTDYGFGWTGPIRSRAQAEREAASWREAGRETEVVPSSPAVRAQVRQWERTKPTRRAS